MKKKLLSLCALSVLTIGGLMAITSCGDKGVADGTRVAYVLDSSSTPATNLIRAEVSAKDGKVTKVVYDEVKFNGATIGLSSEEAANEFGVNYYVSITGTSSTKFYAKYLNVNGTVFTADVSSGTLAYKNGTTDYDATYGALTAQADLADFYHNLVNNNIFASAKDGTRATGLTSTIYSKASGLTSYWTSNAYTTYTWKENVAKIAAALVGKDITNVDAAKVKDTAGTIDSVDTGATITCFTDYVKAAKLAFTGESAIGVAYALDSSSTPATNIMMAEVIKAEGKAKKVYFDEVKFNGATIGLSSEDAANEFGVNYYVSITGTSSTKFYAKYLNFNGTVFTADVSSGAVAYKNGTTGYDATYGVLTEQADLADFYHNLVNNNIFASAKDGTKATGLTSNIFNKASGLTSYWTSNAYTTYTWKENVAKIATALEGKDITNVVGAKVKDTAGTIDSVDTGATITCFVDYVNVAKAAYSVL